MKLGDWLADGPFALAMSSGFFGFFAHSGMLVSLEARGLAPDLVAGSSAGALVAGAWGSGVDADMLATGLLSLTRDDFWDPAFGAGLLAGRKFDTLLRELLPVGDFAACRVPVKISVFDIAARRTVVIDSGELSPAVRASCAVPVMFHPVRIAGRAYWDGGILDRPGLAGVEPDRRVLFHHLASRSPWRTRPPELPRRPNLVALVIDDLPRSGPWKLDQGARALDVARRATDRALDSEIVDGIVRVRG